MSRTFLYARVSTADQTTANQLLEVRTAGFDVKAKYIVEETVSGSTAAADRPMFGKLLDKLDEGDTLVVTKLDRLGRNTTDVLNTVEALAKGGVKLHCLALKGTDLTSPAGKLHLTVLAAVSQFERDLLIERTYAGLARAKEQGKVAGRKDALSLVAAKRGVTVAALHQEIRNRLAEGSTARGLAKEYGVSHPTISKAVASDSKAVQAA
ncbi:Tn3 family transposase ISYps3 [Paraburkholderia domus]|uniref:recombinase family protein n=1 Tax=Paraburkholderia domus TaxID=2793075 RepID=UPI001B04B633|nr:recombinase family protein [Paraburkholderia domus]CAE6968399.1 Tn3 family transposase ISYps3 [Paraburkholderia domus]